MKKVYTLEPLPYKHNALEPYISRETLSYHYDKHHATYVTKLNALQQDKSVPLEHLIMESKTPIKIFQNAAQIWNHNFYWHSMRPAQKHNKPNHNHQQHTSYALVQSFGSFENFKHAFIQEAVNHFGSGWVWLCRDAHANPSKLCIVSTHDADVPMRAHGKIPLMTCDVWEHAYYVDYRNDRAKYLEQWFDLVNWDFVEYNINNEPTYMELLKNKKVTSSL